MTGNTLPRLQTNDIESLLVPLPPLEVQQEIATGVRQFYERAKLLRTQGAAIVARARGEVEQMILGAE